MDDYKAQPLITYGKSGEKFAYKTFAVLKGQLGGNDGLNQNFKLVDSERVEFPSGELKAVIKGSVRGRNVYIIQCDVDRIADPLELLILNDAAKRAYAGKIIDVLTYFPFSRQDRKASGREPITAKLYARLLETSGADAVCTMDLHAAQIQGFFEIPCDNLESLSAFAIDIEQRYGNFGNIAFVAPDEGSWKRIKDVVKNLGIGEIPIAVVNKRRVSGDKVETYNVVGIESLKGRHAVGLDDEIDTASTIEGGSNSIMESRYRPKTLAWYATHGAFSSPANERIDNAYRKYDIEVVTTDTIPQEQKPWKTVISMVPIFAHAIDRIERCDSVSALFRLDTIREIMGRKN
ncbi:MAG: ribose-phosphate diphosphokinase [Candidatus Aenigmarchaeota archaeon]|nr:ribose-phosphate diphosphokinase [Candidatus Aenigmarchaeota archaeon]